ncbi:MAG TPA: hypothetical protein VIK55_19290 [Paludibacter sp.]
MKTNKHISLEEIGKELPFSVPENYFEQFASQLEEQIGYKNVSIRRLLKPWMYMAAMFVGILMMGQVFYTVYQNNTVKNADNYESYVLSQVDETALMDYYVDESVK